jgi:hypothetical protein
VIAPPAPPAASIRQYTQLVARVQLDFLIERSRRPSMPAVRKELSA